MQLECRVVGRWALDQLLASVRGEIREIEIASGLVDRGLTPEPGATITAEVDDSGKIVSWQPVVEAC
jgi:hypothetical protein